MDEQIDATLAALGIGDLAERLPTGLSGGEQQRVAIAAILCMGPRLIVLDEPTAQLDPAATRAVAELLAGRAAAGTAVLVAEHEAAVLGLAERCLVLDGGRAAGMERPGVALGAGAGRPCRRLRAGGGGPRGGPGGAPGGGAGPGGRRGGPQGSRTRATRRRRRGSRRGTGGVERRRGR